MTDSHSNIRITRKLLVRIFTNICVSATNFYLNDPCWEWTAGLKDGGYGQFRVKGLSSRLAHRLIYQVFVELVPDHLTCDHLCRNRLCVNPFHIEIVTGAVNVLRSESFVAVNARKTHCLRGHPLSGSNLSIRRGSCEYFADITGLTHSK